jgi:hypothetical protein
VQREPRHLREVAWLGLVVAFEHDWRGKGNPQTLNWMQQGAGCTCEKWRAEASLSPVSMVTCTARFRVSTPAQRPVCRSVTAARLASFSVSCNQ